MVQDQNCQLPPQSANTADDDDLPILPLADAIGSFQVILELAPFLISQGSNFTLLKDLEPGKLVNVIGVVGAFRDITRAAYGRRGLPNFSRSPLISRLQLINHDL